MYQRDKKKKDYTKEEWAVMAATRKSYLKNLVPRSSEPMCENAKYWLAKKWTNRKRKFIPQPTLASYYMKAA